MNGRLPTWMRLGAALGGLVLVAVTVAGLVVLCWVLSGWRGA